MAANMESYLRFKSLYASFKKTLNTKRNSFWYHVGYTRQMSSFVIRNFRAEAIRKKDLVCTHHACHVMQESHVIAIIAINILITKTTVLETMMIITTTNNYNNKKKNKNNSQSKGQPRIFLTFYKTLRTTNCLQHGIRRMTYQVTEGRSCFFSPHPSHSSPPRWPSG